MNAKCLPSQTILFTFLMHFAALFSIVTHTATAHTSTMGDHLALLAIKSVITDDPEGAMTLWNHSNTNFCLWEGVTCNTRHQRVTQLKLNGRGLNGTLSPTIGNLSFLRVLELQGNSFSGGIPPEIGNLYRIQTLVLSYNLFTGNIPATIMNCSNLQLLDLGSNHLVGKIPDRLASLSMLNTIYLYDNILKGGIPPFIANLTLLEELNLDNCQLGGTFLDVFQRLTNLGHLTLAGNNLTGTIPPSLYNSSSLYALDLEDNQLSGTLPKNMGSLIPRLIILYLSRNHIQGSLLDIPPTLEYLDLSFNNFEGKLPSLSNASSVFSLDLSNNLFVGLLHNLVCSNGVNKIESLHLGNNQLSGDIEGCWEKWSSLYYLSLRNNNLSGEFPKSLRRLAPKLSYLDISENKFQGTLKSWSITKTPEILDLSSNAFDGSLHEFLCSNGSKGTKALNLRNNRFSSVIPNCWENWTSLAMLNLRNNKLSGEIPKSLMRLSKLKILELGRNELVGSIPKWIGTKLTVLRILNFRFNKFVGNIPRELCYLSRVQILDFAHNYLSGSIPRCFNNFSILSGRTTNREVQVSLSAFDFVASDSFVIKGHEYTYEVFLGLVMLLDLSSNNFSGQIPSELMTLWKLQSLNLSRNQLTGKIPDKIGEMRSLESLDMSVNKLSGKLPMSLSGLYSLSHFNVSYNNLIGKVPTSTQIQSFDDSSFFGNKLCGAPLANVCVSTGVPYTTQDQKIDIVSHEADRGFIISVSLGSVCGFWSIVAPLIMSTSWRMAYFRLISKFI